jgi:hypothetical protein
MFYKGYYWTGSLLKEAYHVNKTFEEIQKDVENRSLNPRHLEQQWKSKMTQTEASVSSRSQSFAITLVKIELQIRFNYITSTLKPRVIHNGTITVVELLPFTYVQKMF